MRKALAARLALTALVSVAALCATATPAHAHALLVGSEPAQGARLERSPPEVRLDLTEQPDVAASSIRVLNAQGQAVEQGPATADGLELAVRLPDLPEGVYTVTWRVLSRVDGHVTGGAFAFGVRADPSDAVIPEEQVGPRPSVGGVAGRTMLYAGGFLIIGAAVGRWAFGTGAGRMLRAARIGWTIAVLGVLSIAAGQAADAGIALGQVVSSSIGTSMLWRLVPLAVAAVPLFVLRMPAAAAILMILAFGAHVFYGHAGAGSDRLIKIGAQLIHVTAAAVWIGGLVALLVGSKSAEPAVRGRAAKRYSTLALVMFFVVAVFGSLRAFDEVGSWSALVSTTFGRLVLLKIGLLIALVAMGAFNRYRTVPRMADEPQRLLRVGRIEVVVATIVLIATGVLASVAPAKDAVEATEDVTATGTDFGRTIEATLRVTPGSTGPNEFEVELRAPDSGEPIDPEEVALRFIYAGVPSVEQTELALRKAGDGRYVAKGSNLAVPGPWVVVVSTRTGVNSAEVRLAIGTRTRQQVTPIEQAGAPTIYDIALGEGRVQMYLQPGTPGVNEVHATFFDEQGREDARATGAVLVATPPTGDPRRLRVRVLTPGHFVADAELTAGRWRFDVFAETDGGRSQTAWFVQNVET